MSEIVKVENSTIFESKEYFELIKSTKKKITKKDLEKSLVVLAEEYQLSTAIGQTKMANRLKFYIESTMKQLDLVSTNFNSFVESSTISEYIDKVRPKNSVKIVELERYCRIIPKDCIEKISIAKSLEVFDEVLILYTDMTGQNNVTKEEQAMIARNKDPIAFGIFQNKELEITNPRFFVIADWVDEWCDLTFDKLITECVKYNIEENVGELKQSKLDSIIGICKGIIDV